MLKRKNSKIRIIKEDNNPGKLIERIEEASDPVIDAIQMEEEKDMKRDKSLKKRLRFNKPNLNY